MRLFTVIFLLIQVVLFASLKQARATQFDVFASKRKVTIVYSKNTAKLDSITANLLASDIQRVSGYLPAVLNDISKAKGNVIVIGSVQSPLIVSLGKQLNLQSLQGKWECYHLAILNHPLKNINQALIIAGSDPRGTAYGVFDISERIGVTPWYWWADAYSVKKKILILNIQEFTSAPPSVKYRGIFINDEDWGLQPWAAQTLEPETGDIGPKTYAKVFELLLRLKANLIWPAMHPSTKAFYHYPGNIKMAEDYQIVIGSSHAEPMLRNNVSEWDEKTMGAFNYITNQQKVDDYWETRVKESSHINGIYTIGMRGVHDSGIEGVKTISETVPLVERIFADQRQMLKKYVNSDISKVPQAFTAYKEVLDVYDAGLKIPDDVTLVWPDDNYGYIQRLSNQEESKRGGGAGIYYHLSYWGRPHDYIWLSSTSPGLIREEMTKAYGMQARNIWVVNVGDIKPAEYNIQFFLDMAYHIKPFYDSNYSKSHLKHWIAANLGDKNADQITDVLWKYNQLAFERRPEFMGWSQTEPTTPIKFTGYNQQYYGDQAQQRIDAYAKLEQEVKALSSTINPDKQDCFYQLVYYPVVGASLMNKKFLYRDKANLYAQQGRLSTPYYNSLSKAAYQGIVDETEYYNTRLSAGKWAHIMSMNPRGLPVYQLPSLNDKPVKRDEAWLVIPEGFAIDSAKHNGGTQLSLPAYHQGNQQKYFIDIFLTRDTSVDYTIKTSATWIRVAQQTGQLLPYGDKSQYRLWVNIDWTKAPAGKNLNGDIIIKSAGKSFTINIKADNHQLATLKGYKGFIENDGYISIYAKDYQRNQNKGANAWTAVTGFGATEKSLEALPLKVNSTLKNDETANITTMPAVSYNFFTFNNSPAEVEIYTIPTYPINRNFQMRYAISVDNTPPVILNFKTIGRSEEWKQAVLSNAISRSVKIPVLNAGKHTLHIYMIDPGVILDRILIDLGGLKPLYGLIPETTLIR